MRAPGSATPAFDAALREARKNPESPQPHCKDRPALFVDYEESPGEEEADLLCGPCPLFKLCLESARVEKPAWGVRGGRAWVDGKQHAWMVKLGYEKDF